MSLEDVFDWPMTVILVLLIVVGLPAAIYGRYLTNAHVNAGCAARGMQVQPSPVYNSNNGRMFYLCRDKDGRVFSVEG